MASHHLLSFTLTTLLFSFISPSHSFRNDVLKVSSPVKSQKVVLSLYYESLCPSCASFIATELVKVFDTDLSTIVDLKLIPWGNAQLSEPHKDVMCQHGENECYLNTIHACAIKAWPNVKEHFKFIRCIEDQAQTRVMQHSDVAESEWRHCSDKLGFSQEPIDSCYKSGEGAKLVLKYANETDSLNPPHQYVPWVIVNDEVLKNDYSNFIDYVCKEYKGKQVPNACKSHHRNKSTMKETSIRSVSYAAVVAANEPKPPETAMEPHPPAA